MSKHILDGYKVLDFTRYIAGPFCCQILADMGAEVIRVERPEGEPDRQRGPIGPDGQSLYFLCLNRNKKCITLNLDRPAGQQALADLVQRVDVLVHNQPVDRARALGLEYEKLKRVNPKLVFVSVSGYGSVGPYARYSAFDAVIQAISGAASLTGRGGGGPTLSHIPYVDFGTALYGALSVSLALLHRERSGMGQEVDLALLGTAMSFVTAYGIPAEVEINQVVRRPAGNDMIYGVGGMYPCKDGLVVLCSFADGLWRRVCKVIGRPDLLDDPRLGDDLERYENRELVDTAIGEWTAGYSVEQACQIMSKAGIPIGPVQTVDKVASHPQVQALELIRRIEQPGVGELPVNGCAMRFGLTPAVIDRPAPALGQHNQEVYDALLGSGAFDRLRSEGAA